MLKIWSEWQLDPHDPRGFFTLYMQKDGDIFNSSVSADTINNPDVIISTLTYVINALVKEVYPELNNPLYKAKKRLKEIEMEKESLINMITEMEKKNEPRTK